MPPGLQSRSLIRRYKQATLMVPLPVLFLPISYFVVKGKDWLAVLGIALAIAGVSILFLA